MKRSQLTRRIALAGVLGALAIALSYLESLIPAFPGFPPGAKPGLSNIVTMFLASSAGVCDAFFITIIKGLFAGITRGFTAMLMSLSGGILSTAAACIIFKTQKNHFGYIGIGIICAVCHNIGQLITACVISSTPSLIWGYGPLLLIFAVITGFITGSILKAVMPSLKSIYKGKNKFQ
ncbi:MAG: Gx transporter family protein [Ruminococcus sp.]|nr:Gx transporter family protein [Candidatus Copronaster equi]